MQELASRAKAGNKLAQFELGKRLEEGKGLPRNVKLAESLYRKASADSRNDIWVYVPSGDSSTGRVEKLYEGGINTGLPEARRQLEVLRCKNIAATKQGKNTCD